MNHIGARGKAKFSKKIVDLIGRRAGSICSNPDCGAITTGPDSTGSGVVVVGEAAHIFGANEGAARYRSEMTDVERADVTNAVWLCRICHKKIDADASKYTPELLFSWRRHHEGFIMEKLGRSGDQLKDRISEELLSKLPGIGSYTKQIVRDKPSYWEYKLTAAILRDLMDPVFDKWRALDGGLYALVGHEVPHNKFFDWFRQKLASYSAQVNALNVLVNEELPKSWGPPGRAGSEQAIYRVCSLIRDACERILLIEEDVRFAWFDDQYSEVVGLIKGIGGRQINKMMGISPFIEDIFQNERPSGTFEFEIVFDMPPKWEDQIEDKMELLSKKLQGDRGHTSQ